MYLFDSYLSRKYQLFAFGAANKKWYVFLKLI